ncbi:MAG: hypothetical protein M1838_005655 [Thelocarpon superellum]|nr:MAG: hypothetical protein M1838_005655 [Thelocarpon superellum]
MPPDRYDHGDPADRRGRGGPTGTSNTPVGGFTASAAKETMGSEEDLAVLSSPERSIVFALAPGISRAIRETYETRQGVTGPRSITGGRSDQRDDLSEAYRASFAVGSLAARTHIVRAAGSLLSDSHPSGEEHVAYHAIDLMQVTRRLDALEERTEEASTRRTTWRTMELADTISPPPLVDVPPNAMDDYSGILDDFSDVGSGNTEFVEWLDESLRRSGFVDIVYRDPFLAAPTSRAIPSFAPVPSESHWASDPRPEEEVWPVAPEANPPGVGNVHSVETLYDSPMTVSHGSDQDPSPPRDSHPYLLIGAIRPTPARSPALSLRRTSHVIIAPVSGIISQSAAAETMPKASPALLAPQPPGPASRRRRDGLTLTDVDPDAPRLSLASSSASEQGEAREEWRRRQALWARAVATRQKREREQVLRRRAEMGWNL